MELFAENRKIAVTGKMNKPDAYSTASYLDLVTFMKVLGYLTIN